MQANSTLLTEALCDNLHLGLVLDAACWSKELLQGLMFIDSSQDWRCNKVIVSQARSDVEEAADRPHPHYPVVSREIHSKAV
jgi:hypothetical protein